MPRKTKKDKVIAKLKRRIEQPKSPAFTQLQSPNSNLPTSISYPFSLIKKDLTKTISLAILAISLELGVYFLSKLEFLPF